MLDPDRLVRLGVFGAAQGVRGEVRVKSFTADPKAIASYGALTDGAAGRRFAFKFVRAMKDDMIVVRVEGVDERDAAEALTGVELFARRSQLPAPAEGEYYHFDLVGLKTATRAGEVLGHVVAVLNYGAGDILEVSPEGGGETLLLPFNATTAPEVDFDAGYIVVDRPNEVEDESAEEV
jgi:16S rRNA processing protein RimM